MLPSVAVATKSATMFAGIRKRLSRKQIDIKDCEDDDKDTLHAFTPPANYIKVAQGKIHFAPPQSRSLDGDTTINAQTQKETESLEKRIVELEETLQRLQAQVINNQCGSPMFEKELREQLENMNRVMKSKERKQVQTCRDHKALQTRFARQESLLHAMQQENKALLQRVRQYEHCLDDVMRKVVDAIVAEDNLREEVTVLKSRVLDLEAQNAALSGSPAKGRDEGYCTMSSGQPQPSNGQLEDLPEEPEQWLLPAEPCSTEMEDWSMSQEELAVITLDEERELLQQQQQRQDQQPQQRHPQKRLGDHEWIWNSSDYLNSTLMETDGVSDNISQLLQQKLVYSEDEEVTCTEFTNEFYKLVNIYSSTARSPYSYIEGDTDDEDDDDDEDDSSLTDTNDRLQCCKDICRQRKSSPTPSEAGRAHLASCSSSETDELSNSTATTTTHQETQELPVAAVKEAGTAQLNSDINVEDMQNEAVFAHRQIQNGLQCNGLATPTEQRRPAHMLLVKSKSTIDEDEPSCILRNHQRRELEAGVVRSGSVNGGIVAAAGGTNARVELQRQQKAFATTSWRRSNGWKRVTSPTATPMASVSPKKEIKLSTAKNCLPLSTSAAATQRQTCRSTRIPTCKIMPATNLQQSNMVRLALRKQSFSPPLSPQQQQQQQKQFQPKQQATTTTKKSKIPPPVPVRRSYAS